jgi:serine/threonine protein kinase
LGTPAYFAPEIVMRSGHTRMLDWYNLGILLYEFLVGMPPFYAKDRVKYIKNFLKEQLFENIKKSPIKIPKSMSLEARDLIKQVYFFIL